MTEKRAKRSITPAAEIEMLNLLICATFQKTAPNDKKQL